VGICEVCFKAHLIFVPLAAGVFLAQRILEKEEQE